VSDADIGEITEAFSFFDDWEDKYRFIIDLGKSLPDLPEADKREENLVRGCQSQVWLHVDYNTSSNRMALRIDSDAHIVRGLIAIVLAAYDQRTPDEVLQYDIEGLFDELQLLKHLSPTRGNGLRALIGRVRAHAESVSGGEPGAQT
jgi:cysteine desulfuration protein SufE